jgi:thioredoxin 1
MAIIECTEANFAEVTANGIVLVDFWAPWCGPCRMQGPILETLAEEMKGSVAIAKVNVDDNASLAGRFSITAIPALLIFKDGKLAKQMVGLHQAADLKKTLEAL